jgi:hypothetical protein
MRKRIVFILFFLALVSLHAQSRFSLSFSQSYSKDWQSGEKHILESSLFFENKTNFNIDKFNNASTIKIALGCQLVRDKDYSGVDYFTPTDNELYFDYQLKYMLGWLLDPFVSFTVSTPVVESFILSQSKRSVTSAFRDPITTMQGMGFAFSLNDSIKTITSRIGVSLKQVRAHLNTRLTDDYSTSGVIERYKPESGINFKTELTYYISKDLIYRSNAEFFGTFKILELWTVKWQNEIQVNIWKFLCILIKADVYYDEKQKAELQFKQSTRFAVAANL